MIRAVVLPGCRACLRALQTDRERVGPLGAFVRAVLLLPPFGLLLIVLRLRLLVRGPLVVDGETLDGVRLSCELPDLIQMYVHLFRAWEPDLTAFVRRRLQPGDTCIDVGANVGCVAALAARCVGATGRVFAVEPAPDVIAALRATLQRNGADNVEVIPFAASDRRERLQLFAGPGHNKGLTATVSHRGLRAHGHVDAAPLPELLAAVDLAAVRLVKIDVEGAEDRVLLGMVPMLDRLPPTAEIAIEFSPLWWADAQRRPIEVLQPFLAAGFHVYVLPNSYWPWRYLWPRAVTPPQRRRDLGAFERRFARLDVVLSRLDQDEL